MAKPVGVLRKWPTEQAWKPSLAARKILIAHLMVQSSIDSRKELHAEKAGVREVSREHAHEVRAEVDLICLAEALSDKCYAFTIRRPRGAFAERNQLRDIQRQGFFRRARLAVRRPKLHRHYPSRPFCREITLAAQSAHDVARAMSQRPSLAAAAR